jgi:hypothetical protein
MENRRIILTPNFYIIPPRSHALGFEGPASADAMINFFQSEAGCNYRVAVNKLFKTLIKWARENIPVMEVSAKPLIVYIADDSDSQPLFERNELVQIINHFENRFHQPVGDVDARAVKFKLFTRGVSALQKIVSILLPSDPVLQASAVVNKVRHISLIKELILTFDACSSGAEKKILDVATEMSEDISEFSHSLRMHLANQHAKELFAHNEYIANDYAGNEIHNINYLLDLVADVVHIRPSLDELVGDADDDLLKEIEALSPILVSTFNTVLTFDYVIDQLLERVGLSNLYEGINYSNSAAKLLALKRGLEFIGRDETLDNNLENDSSLFLHADTHAVLNRELPLNEEIDALTNLPTVLVSKYNMELQLRVSIVERLKKLNWFILDWQVSSRPTFTLHLLKNASLHYAFILGNNHRIPYLIYFTELLMLRKYIQIEEELNQLSNPNKFDVFKYFSCNEYASANSASCSISILAILNRYLINHPGAVDLNHHQLDPEKFALFLLTRSQKNNDYLNLKYFKQAATLFFEGFHQASVHEKLLSAFRSLLKKTNVERMISVCLYPIYIQLLLYGIDQKFYCSSKLRAYKREIFDAYLLKKIDWFHEGATVNHRAAQFLLEHLESHSLTDVRKCCVKIKVLELLGHADKALPVESKTLYRRLLAINVFTECNELIANARKKQIDSLNLQIKLIKFYSSLSSHFQQSYWCTNRALIAWKREFAQILKVDNPVVQKQLWEDFKKKYPRDCFKSYALLPKYFDQLNSAFLLQPTLRPSFSIANWRMT